MNVSEILINSLSPDPAVREKATATLEQAACQNYVIILCALISRDFIWISCCLSCRTKHLIRMLEVLLG